MKSFPMLDTRFAEDIVRDSVEAHRSIAELAERVSTNHPKSRISETGKSSVTEQDLENLRDDIVQVARKYGYPEPQARDGKLSDFDREATHVLMDHVDTPVNDARSTELWNFLTTVLLLDVASWRFPNTSENPRFKRYLGSSPKSAFKKLWWRGYVLHDLSDSIGEDQSVALLERTSVAGDPRLPKTIIRRFFDSTSENTDAKNLSEAFRSTMLITKARLRTLCVESLDDDQLEQLVQDCVNRGLTR